MRDALRFAGTYWLTALDPDGTIKWTDTAHNRVFDAAKAYALEVALGGGGQIATWYIGLVSSTPTPDPDPSDTLASHPGWVEETAYDGERKLWTPNPVANNRIDNIGQVAEFTINQDSTEIVGPMICSVAIGNVGLLWSAGQFDKGAKEFDQGDIVRVAFGARVP